MEIYIQSVCILAVVTTILWLLKYKSFKKRKKTLNENLSKIGIWVSFRKREVVLDDNENSNSDLKDFSVYNNITLINVILFFALPYLNILVVAFISSSIFNKNNLLEKRQYESIEEIRKILFESILKFHLYSLLEKNEFLWKPFINYKIDNEINNMDLNTLGEQLRFLPILLASYEYRLGFDVNKVTLDDFNKISQLIILFNLDLSSLSNINQFVSYLNPNLLTPPHILENSVIKNAFPKLNLIENKNKIILDSILKNKDMESSYNYYTSLHRSSDIYHNKFKNFDDYSELYTYLCKLYDYR